MRFKKRPPLPEQLMAKLLTNVSNPEASFTRHRKDITSTTTRSILSHVAEVEGVSCVIEYIVYRYPKDKAKPTRALHFRVDGRTYIAKTIERPITAKIRRIMQMIEATK